MKEEGKELVVKQDRDYSIQSVKDQVSAINELLNEIMIDGTHYGVIPGAGDKKVLLKAGAEKICSLFGIAPKYSIETISYENNHKEYIINCDLQKIKTGEFIGSGVGSCSTLEKKYRYRKVSTGRPVPREYWEDRDPDHLGGKEFSPVKDENGRWYISEKGENPDIADMYNTVLKMAKKRALVDAVLTATSASDIFAQDIEETHQMKQPSDSERVDNLPDDVKSLLRDSGYNTIGKVKEFMSSVNWDDDRARNELTIASVIDAELSEDENETIRNN